MSGRGDSLLHGVSIAKEAVRYLAGKKRCSFTTAKHCIGCWPERRRVSLYKVVAEKILRGKIIPKERHHEGNPAQG